MHEESHKTIEIRPGQWWLAKNGEAEGPLSHQEISDALKSNRIKTADYAYSSDQKEWKPLAAWSEFESVNEDSAPQLPPAPPVESYSIKPFLTHPRLPPMANSICIYTLLISPWLWCFYFISLLHTGTALNENASLAGVEALFLFVNLFVSLVATVSLFIGGLRFRSLQRSGPTIIVYTITATLVIQVFLFLCMFALAAFTEQSDFIQQTAAVEMINYLSVIVGICELIFMIMVVLWFRRNARYLPLS